MGGSTGSGTKAAAARTLFAGRPNAGTNIAFNPSFTRIVTCRSMLGVDYPSIDEMMAGGERYELVPLPNKMMDTTVWVGSLDEFVTDDDLSNLFSEVSALSSLPACVARNPNASSRMYGFVTFPSVEEKEVKDTSRAFCDALNTAIRHWYLFSRIYVTSNAVPSFSFPM